MSIFLEIADQYEIADTALAGAEQGALQALDEAAFDRATKARQRNDQAYFLYLFTRLEAEVNAAVLALVGMRAASSVPWSDRRIWQAWKRTKIGDIALLSKIEVLTDKEQGDYAKAKEYYDGRNTIAHGDDWNVQFFVPDIARSMRDMTQRFAWT